MDAIILSQIIGAILLSIGLVISAIRKKTLISIAIIIIGIAFFLLIRSL